MEFSKSCSSNDESNESINQWNVARWNSGNHIVNAIRSSSSANQDYDPIMQTCSRFQIVKQKEKWLLPRFYIVTHEMVKIADFG